MSYYKERYLAYLRSDHWASLKRALYSLDDPHCECCGIIHGLDAHHLVYRNPLHLGTVSDLMMLCRPCHTIVHAHKTKFLTAQDIVTQEKRRRILIYCRGLAKQSVDQRSLTWARRHNNETQLLNNLRSQHAH